MGWVATLKDGQAIAEGKTRPGELSSWQSLLKHCRDNDTYVVKLQLTINNVTVEALPNNMCSGYFQAYESSKIMFRDKVTNKQGIGSIVNNLVYITWIDLSASGNGMNYVHTEIRNLEEVKIHTIIN